MIPSDFASFVVIAFSISLSMVTVCVCVCCLWHFYYKLEHMGRILNQILNRNLIPQEPEQEFTACEPFLVREETLIQAVIDILDTIHLCESNGQPVHISQLGITRISGLYNEWIHHKDKEDLPARVAIMPEIFRVCCLISQEAYKWPDSERPPAFVNLQDLCKISRIERKS